MDVTNPCGHSSSSPSRIVVNTPPVLEVAEELVTATKETTFSIYGRLEALEKNWSEQKAVLDMQVNDRSQLQQQQLSRGLSIFERVELLEESWSEQKADLDRQMKDCLLANEQQQQQLQQLKETTSEASFSSMYERLEVLEKSWSEQKADLDNQVADQSCNLEITMMDMQEKVMAMLKDQRAEVRKDVMAMMRCTLFDQTVATSPKLTNMVSECCQAVTSVQAHAASGGPTANLPPSAKQVSNAKQGIPLPAFPQQPTTSGNPRLASDADNGSENLSEYHEYLMKRLHRLEEKIGKLAEEVSLPAEAVSWPLGNTQHPKTGITTQQLQGQRQAHGKSLQVRHLLGDVGLTDARRQESKAWHPFNDASRCESTRTSTTYQQSLQHSLNEVSKASRWKKRHHSSAKCLRGTGSSCSRVCSRSSCSSSKTHFSL